MENNLVFTIDVSNLYNWLCTYIILCYFIGLIYIRYNVGRDKREYTNDYGTSQYRSGVFLLFLLSPVIVTCIILGYCFMGIEYLFRLFYKVITFGI